MSGRLQNRIQYYRSTRGWSQDELARRSELSRTAISAMELGRVEPSTAAALALASVFGCRVEELFELRGNKPAALPAWACPPPARPQPFWCAEVRGRKLLYPVERTLVGALAADGCERAGTLEFRSSVDADRTLVVAGCDPASGLLAAELNRMAGIRLLPLMRSSRQALDLLRRDVVHVAGLHLQDEEAPNGNEQAVRELLGSDFTLVRLTRWQEGLALAPGLDLRSIRRAVAAKLRWVGREPGSGARRCLDSILKDQRTRPRGYHHMAADHLGVAQTIRSGWAQAGICVKLAAVEAGLDFIVVREEDYDLCFRSDSERDPRLQALLRTVRSAGFRTSMSQMPGYDSSETGSSHRLQA